METIKFDKAEVSMLVQLLNEAAAKGPDAATLGRLYAKVKAASDRLNPPKAAKDAA